MFSMAQTYITYEDGSTFTVPEESSVVVTDMRVFSLTKTDNDFSFAEVAPNRFRDGVEGEIDEPVEEPVVEPVEAPEKRCTTDGPIRWVTGQGWTFCNGEGWVLGGPEDQVASKMFLEKRADLVSRLGDWERYSSTTLDGLKRKVTGNTWWQFRLRGLANEVASGNNYRWLREFGTTSETMQDYAVDVVNMYIALQKAGYSDSQIDAYIWG